MATAVLVSGSEIQFEEGSGFQVMTLRSIGFGPVHGVRARRIPRRAFTERFERAVRGAAGDDPLLISYSGHGDGDTWVPYDEGAYEYARLGELILPRAAATLIVNDCCDSWSLAEVLQDLGADPERVGVIASTDRQHCDSFDSALMSRVAAVWQTGRTFEAGGAMHFAVAGTGRHGTTGAFMPDYTLRTIWKAVLSEGKRIHTQRSARWGEINDDAFMQAAS